MPAVARSTARTPRPAMAATAAADALDAPVRLVPGRLWAGLAGFALLIAAFVVWAVVATLPEHVSAAGVTLNGPAVAAVEAPSAGSVTSIDVAPGMPVGKAGVIGVISSGAGRIIVRAPLAGTVIGLSASDGQELAAGAPLATIDPSGMPPRAVLFVTSVHDLAQLAPGQTVELAGATDTTGRIASITPYPASPADLAARFGTTQVPGLPAGGEPTWLVDVALPPSTPVAPALGPVTATALVGRRHPYQLVFGSSR